MTESHILSAFEKWYDSLKQYGGFPAKGTISGALVVLERLKHTHDLSIDAHTASGGSQIAGASGRAVKEILERFGEIRPFVSEGGRTNRGLRGEIMAMLQALTSAGLESLSATERRDRLTELQRFLVGKVAEFHSRERLKPVYDPSKSVWQFIHQILALADESNKKGPVAQYLVGAKLQVRFPESRIGNESYSTADAQLGRAGDFLLRDTAFHVTVSPLSGVYEKCRRNLDAGLMAYLLVPDAALAGARQNAEAVAPGRIAVESIESFVSQNIEELATFSRGRLRSELRRLLETYNERVGETEIDKSMLFEIPTNLTPSSESD